MPMDQPPVLYMPAQPDFSIKSFSGPTSLTFSNDKGMVVTISMKDGSVTFGEGVTPDAAAKAFWEQITRLYPSICRQQDK